MCHICNNFFWDIESQQIVLPISFVRSLNVWTCHVVDKYQIKSVKILKSKLCNISVESAKAIATDQTITMLTTSDVSLWLNRHIDPTDLMALNNFNIDQYVKYKLVGGFFRRVPSVPTISKASLKKKHVFKTPGMFKKPLVAKKRILTFPTKRQCNIDSHQRDTLRELFIKYLR